MAQTAWQIWRKKIIFIFLPSKKLLKYTVVFLQNWKNKYYPTKQKILLNILGLFCRFEEINILYSTKQKNLLKYYWVFFAELKK